MFFAARYHVPCGVFFFMRIFRVLTRAAAYFRAVIAAAVRAGVFHCHGLVFAIP